MKAGGMYMSRRKKGFTLIEMMIVITIIGLLLSFLLPNMVKAKYQAMFTACQHNERAIASALENYCTDYKGLYPSTLDVIFAEGYLNRARCPTGGAPSYSYVVNYAEHRYTVYCEAGHHRALSDVPEGYPQYDNGRGLCTGIGLNK